MRDVVCTSKAPGVGPYSQAVKGGGFIFVSGQLALDPVTRQIIEGDVRQQTERALKNIAAVLEASGSNLDKVVRCGVFLKNMGDFEPMNDVYGKIFGPHPPARTAVEAARLPKDSLVEIDAIALEWDRTDLDCHNALLSDRIRSLPGGPMAETFEAYRTRVLSYLGDEEPIGVQRATPSQLERRLRDVAPEELIRHPAPGKWSIAEIVAHLVDAELAMGWRLRNMLANPGVVLTWWDQDVWAERLGYAQQDVSFSIGVFRVLRESNLRLLESVPRARWAECYGVHEVRGRQTVEEFVRLEAAHDLNHLRQIDRILGGR